MVYVLFFLLAVLPGYSDGPAPAKKYNLSICVLFKNEAPYLKEWIEYHRLIGVDHFYLYNNGSLDSFARILNPYVRNHQVTLIHWPDRLHFGPEKVEESNHLWPLGTQVTAYENAIKWVAAKETKWLIFLDIDEFLVLPPTDTIQGLLARFDQYPGIILSSEFFDASRKGTLPQRKLVIEAIEITAPRQRDVRRSVEKMILKPDLCTSFSWPPYQCQFKYDANARKINQRELRINCYEDRMKFKSIDKVKKRLHFDTKISEEDKNERKKR